MTCLLLTNQTTVYRLAPLDIEGPCRARARARARRGKSEQAFVHQGRPPSLPRDLCAQRKRERKWDEESAAKLARYMREIPRVYGWTDHDNGWRQADGFCFYKVFFCAMLQSRVAIAIQFDDQNICKLWNLFIQQKFKMVLIVWKCDNPACKTKWWPCKQSAAAGHSGDISPERYTALSSSSIQQSQSVDSDEHCGGAFQKPGVAVIKNKEVACKSWPSLCVWRKW